LTTTNAALCRTPAGGHPASFSLIENQSAAGLSVSDIRAANVAAADVLSFDERYIAGGRAACVAACVLEPEHAGRLMRAVLREEREDPFDGGCPADTEGGEWPTQNGGGGE